MRDYAPQFESKDELKVVDWAYIAIFVVISLALLMTFIQIGISNEQAHLALAQQVFGSGK